MGHVVIIKQPTVVVNTCNVLQRWRPNYCFSPLPTSVFCASRRGRLKLCLCGKSSLWMLECCGRIHQGRLFCWAIDLPLLAREERWRSLGLWRVSCEIWVVWMERNKRTFEVYSGKEVELLWERVRFWASLQASSSGEFMNCSLSSILLNWNTTVNWA